MSSEVTKLFEAEGGEFVTPPSLFATQLAKIKAVVFDWDGVFNDGFKNGTEGSIFSEVDAMGTNLLRYALWKMNAGLPKTAIITGEKNPSAQLLAEREHFDDVFFLSRNKGIAFTSFCKKHSLKADEVLFFFDDVLDLEAAQQCGAKIMIGRHANPLLREFAKRAMAVDYITAHDGGRHGLREGCELVMGLLSLYGPVVKSRMVFSDEYQAYLAARQEIVTTVTNGIA